METHNFKITQNTEDDLRHFLIFEGINKYKGTAFIITYHKTNDILDIKSSSVSEGNVYIVHTNSIYVPVELIRYIFKKLNINVYKEG